MKKSSCIWNYLNDLERQIDDSSCQIIDSTSTISSRLKFQILGLFKKDIGK